MSTQIKIELSIDTKNQEHLTETIAFLQKLNGVTAKQTVTGSEGAPVMVVKQEKPENEVIDQGSGPMPYAEAAALKFYEIKAKFPTIRAKSLSAFLEKAIAAGLVEAPTPEELPEKQDTKAEVAEEATEQTETETDITIEQVRAILSKKVLDHKAAIRAKLTELDSKNVTELDPIYFQTFVDFLNKLG